MENLIALTGSEKQIAWATDIRAEKLPCWRATVESQRTVAATIRETERG